MNRHVSSALAAVMMIVAMMVAVQGCGSDSDDTSTAAEGGSSAGLTDDGQSSSNELVPVRIAAQPAAPSGLVFLGVKQGIFEKHGLDVDITAAPVATSLLLPQLLQGKFEFINTVWLSFMTAREQGLPLIAVAPGDHVGTTDESDYCHVLAPASGASSLAELEGETVALASLKSSSEVAMRAYLAKAGVDPEEVNYVAIPWANMGTAMRNGRVAAGLLCEPFVAQLKDEMELNDLGGAQIAIVDEAPVSVFITSESYLKSDPDVVEKFQTALAESVEYANAHEDEVREIIPTFTGIDPAVAKEMIMPTFGAEYNTAAVQALADQAEKLGILNEPVDVSTIMAPAPGS